MAVSAPRSKRAYVQTYACARVLSAHVPAPGACVTARACCKCKLHVPVPAPHPAPQHRQGRARSQTRRARARHTARRGHRRRSRRTTRTRAGPGACARENQIATAFRVLLFWDNLFARSIKCSPENTRFRSMDATPKIRIDEIALPPATCECPPPPRKPRAASAVPHWQPGVPHHCARRLDLPRPVV
jgi:hypothetical protein